MPGALKTEGLPLEITFPCGAPDRPLSEVFMLLAKIARGSCGRRLVAGHFLIQGQKPQTRIW
jgi:hypothetical protein